MHNNPTLRKPTDIRTLADLGQELAARRKGFQMSQDELADAAGISRRSVYAIEKGKPTAQFDMVLKVCRELGLDIRAHPR